MDEPSSMTREPQARRLDVAIVGGGIIGVMTAIGLLRRGMRVKIYERSPSWHEIGAGFGFTGVARECMKRLDPALFELFSSISQKTSSNEHTRYWDAFHPRTKDEAEDETKSLLFQMPQGELDFWGAVRSQLLLGMAALLPKDVVSFGSRLVNYVEQPDNDRVTLHFADGGIAEANVLIGCDGVHSTIRELLFGPEHPASRPMFSHVVAYRTMVPMAQGIEALGKDKALSACMHCGPDVNMMSYPVLNGTLLNVALFAHEPSEFPNADTMTVPTTRDEIIQVTAGLSPHIGEISRLFPEKSVKWGIYDMFDNPAPDFTRGSVCIAGDAAHASSPHQGAGACMGVEDALVLCEVLEAAQSILSEISLRKNEHGGVETSTSDSLVVKQALRAYAMERMERSQWLVQSSREMGDMYQWRHGPTGRDTDQCRNKLAHASRKLWDFDVDRMIVGVREKAHAQAI